MNTAHNFCFTAFCLSSRFFQTVVTHGIPYLNELDEAAGPPGSLLSSHLLVVLDFVQYVMHTVQSLPQYSFASALTFRVWRRCQHSGKLSTHHDFYRTVHFLLIALPCVHTVALINGYCPAGPPGGLF